MAEFAFALILALSRKICESRDRVKVEERFTTERLTGFDLSGKDAALRQQLPAIGKHAVRMGKGFAMNIIAYDVMHDDAFSKEMGFPYVTLEELLAKSDVITVHCPYFEAPIILSTRTISAL